MRRKTLAEEHPELVPQWGTSNELSPSDVSSGSHKKVWWTCEKGHSWEATIKNRALLGSGCPYCEHRAVLKGYNDLQTLFPDVAKTWSPKNKRKPTDVSSRSNVEVWWRCKQGHEWKARVADRTEGHGCPYCAGHKVWKGFNDLATTHPHLISEWSDKNKDITPESITCKNRSNVWWNCKRCGHEYQAVVYARANGRICPFCVAKEIQRLRTIRIMHREIAKDFLYLLPQLAVIYYSGKCGLTAHTDSETPLGMMVTAYIPELSLVIDYCRSSNEISLKEYISSFNGIRYLNISEKLSETDTLKTIRKALSESHIHVDSRLEDDLETIRRNYSQWRLK